MLLILLVLAIAAGLVTADAGASPPIADASLQNSDTQRTQIWGDVHCDNQVDVHDAIDIIGRWLLRLVSIPECGPNIWGLQVAEPFILDGKSAKWGDVNCDGVVDVADVMVILQFTVGQDTSFEDCPELGTEVTYPTAYLQRWGDTFCDGVVSAVDASQILKRIADPSRIDGCGPNVYGADVMQTMVVNGEPRMWGDVNCSGAVDPVDALAILRFVAGMPQQAGCLPIGVEVTIDY